MLRKSSSAGVRKSFGIVRDGGSSAGLGAGCPSGFLIAGSGNWADGDGFWGDGSGVCPGGAGFVSGGGGGFCGVVCGVGLCSGLDAADLASCAGGVEFCCRTVAGCNGSDHARWTAPGSARAATSKNLTSSLSGRALPRSERKTPSRLLAPPPTEESCKIHYGEPIQNRKAML